MRHDTVMHYNAVRTCIVYETGIIKVNNDDIALVLAIYYRANAESRARPY